MKTPDEIATAKSALLEHCGQHDCDFIPALRIQEAARVDLAIEEFLRAISAERPRAVYWGEDIFNLEAFIESELSDLGWKPGYEDAPDSLWLGPKQVSAALHQTFSTIALRDGTSQYFSAVFSCQGTSYVTTVEPAWSREITDRIAMLVMLRKEDVTASKTIADSEDAELLSALVTELVANHTFRKTRGLNKRVLLAAKLLGDRLPRHPESRVTRLAQGSEPCDSNLAMVVKAADEKIWLDGILPD